MDLSAEQIKKTIVKKAHDLGFFACRIANTETLDEKGLVQWLESGAHGTMKWLEKNPLARCDPKNLLPEAESIICCALSYGENGLYTNGEVKKNRARFARAKDYHVVVAEKLKILENEIRTLNPEAKTRCCVDTSPILEKALGARAGIGWIGKNSLLINKELGSWFVLGEILTDVELTCDSPVENLCGTCTRCIDACPTKALSKGFLDAKNCLSYLTIEHKGEVDQRFWAHLEKDAYGCDLCQEICPFNFEKQD